MSTIYTDPPQSRNEAIIKSTIDGTQYTDPPQSRMEDLLLELKEAIEQGGGGGTTVVANPEGEATDELEKLQVGNDIYGISKDYEEMSNKPQINGETLSGNKTASDLGLQTELKGAQTVSGNPITITDAEPMNAESVVVELEPKQDLHGYDAPWVGGAGKNKLDEDYSTNYTNAVKLPAGTYYYQGFVGDVPSHTNTRLEFSEDNSTWEMVGTPSTDARITTSGWDGGWLESGIATMTFTTTAELYFRVWLVEGTLDNRHLSISSEQLTTFAPYSNICPITGYSEVNVERVGKNLFDKTYSVNNSYLQVDGAIKSDENSWKITKYIPVNGDSSITFSYDATETANNPSVCWYDKDKNFIGGSKYNNQKIKTTTLPSNAKYVRYSIYYSTWEDTAQLELGNQATTYEPYQGNTATIDLDGTKYGGTLDVTEGEYSDEWGIFTEETVGSMTTSTSSAGGLRWIDYSDIQFSLNKNVISNMLPYYSNATDGWWSTTPCVSNNGERIRIYTDATSMVDFQTKYAGLQVVYPLATPSSASTTPTDIPLLENTNNISTDGTNITLKYQPNNVIGECKAYTDEKCSEVLPPLPTTDGTYHLSCEVTSGVGVLSWVSDN